MTPSPHGPDRFVKPQYGHRSFADIPQFIRALLIDGETSILAPEGFARLPQRYETVIVLFVDAFGWRFLQRYHDVYPFLQRFSRRGSVTRLTSQFPSTTTAHVTTLYTGLEVGQHGLFEWFMYEPQLDAMIAPLLFSYAGDDESETLRAAGFDARRLLSIGTEAEAMARNGVASAVMQPEAFAHSSYSLRVGQGTRAVPYASLPDALSNLTDLASQRRSPACIYLYYGDIDTAGHKYGTDSPQFHGEVHDFFTAMEQWYGNVNGRLGDALLVLLADHGQTDVNPATTLYLNRHPDFSRLRPLLRVNGEGAFLMPGGSCRDMFVYVREGAVEEAKGIIEQMVAGKAQVWRVADMIADGYFGSRPVSDLFRARVGDLVILPSAHESVWWFEPGRFEQKFYGHHGGLTAAEMEIPLLLLPV